MIIDRFRRANRVLRSCLAALFLTGSCIVLHSQTEPLELRETLEQVLAANLRLRAGDLERAVSRERVKAEWAIFEPAILATATVEANRRQNTQEQFLSQRASVFDERNESYTGALEGLLPTGGKLRLGAQWRRLENNLQILGGREDVTFAGATLTQPLLRGGGWTGIASQIKLAAADSDLALQEYRRQLGLVLSQTELAFWDLVAGQELVALRRQSFGVAERVLSDNRERVAAGRMTDLDILQAEAGLELRRSGVAEAQQRVLESGTLLSSFLGRSAAGDAITADAILTATDAAPSLEELLEGVHERHPAYLAQTIRLKQEGIRLAYARNQRWPQVDLRASYGLNGLGDGLDRSYDAMASKQFPAWYLGVDVRVPIFAGIRERSQVRAAKIRKEQSLLELRAVEIEILNRVSSLRQRVASLQSRAEALENVVSLNERLLAADLEQLNEGRGDSRRVLEAEQELTDARLEALASRLDHQRALAELLVESGGYLVARGFDLEE
jgi:outer membrane protein TolC